MADTSPNRAIVNRLFYINVGNMPPTDVSSYLDNAKWALNTKSEGLIEQMKTAGDWEDFFIPTRTGETRVEHVLIDADKVRIAKQVDLLEKEEWFKLVEKVER